MFRVAKLSHIFARHQILGKIYDPLFPVTILALLVGRRGRRMKASFVATLGGRVQVATKYF
jgi:hypothetical protein